MGVQTLFIDKKAGGEASARILSCLLNCGCREQPWSPLRRGREGDRDAHLPRIQSHSEATSPSLQRRLQTVDVWVVFLCDRCMLWVQLSCGSICILVFISFSWAARFHVQLYSGQVCIRVWSCSLWQNAHFLADTIFFCLFFFSPGCSRSSWAQITFIPVSLFSYHGPPAS